MKQSVELAKDGFESAFFGNIVKEYNNLILHFLSRKRNSEFFHYIQKQLNSDLKNNVKSTKIFEGYPDLLSNSLSKIILDEKIYEDNKIKNKALLQPLNLVFRNWYKKQFPEFSKIITKEVLLDFIQMPLKKLYDNAYENEISKIPDFEFLTAFHKNAHKENIKNLLQPQNKNLQKKF